MMSACFDDFVEVKSLLTLGCLGMSHGDLIVIITDAVRVKNIENTY